MSWIDDIIKTGVMRAFDDPQIQAKAIQAILKALDDPLVIGKIRNIASLPVPPPTPTPTPRPIPVTTHIYIADMDLIPQRMRDEGGIVGRDGILWYGLACSCRGNRGWSNLDNAEIHAIYDQEAAIQVWYDKWMADIEYRFQNEPGLRGTVLLNDGKDRIGCTLGPAIMERLSKYSDRLEMGILVPESEY
jgi:hypothetical protein